MTTDRGFIDRRRQADKCPFVVETPIPGSGLRKRLDEMHAWAKSACGNDRYMTGSRVDRTDPMNPVEVLQVRFADEAVAIAFAEAFGADYRGRQDVRRPRRK